MRVGTPLVGRAPVRRHLCRMPLRMSARPSSSRAWQRKRALTAALGSVYVGRGGVCQPGAAWLSRTWLVWWTPLSRATASFALRQRCD